MADNMFGDPVPKAAFGIPGLDDILAGGLQRDSVFLLEGSPGYRQNDDGAPVSAHRR